MLGKGREYLVIPVIVLEVVNVVGLPDKVGIRDMACAHCLFDALMTQAFESGNIVIGVRKRKKSHTFCKI